MTTAAALVEDDMLEDPFFIFGTSGAQLSNAVIEYLVARKLIGPQEVPAGANPVNWLWDWLDNQDGITVSMWEHGDPDVYTVGMFRQWISDSAEMLSRLDT